MSQCARCYRAATVRAVGHFANNRPAVEPLCSRDAPPVEQIGTFRYLGNSDRSYRLDRIELLIAEVAR